MPSQIKTLMRGGIEESDFMCYTDTNRELLEPPHTGGIFYAEKEERAGVRET